MPWGRGYRRAMLTTRRRLERMKRSLALAAALPADLRAADFSPFAIRSAASRPASMARDSSRSSSALSRATLPMSFRYRPIESFILLLSTVLLVCAFRGDGLQTRSRCRLGFVPPIQTSAADARDADSQ